MSRSVSRVRLAKCSSCDLLTSDLKPAMRASCSSTAYADMPLSAGTLTLLCSPDLFKPFPGCFWRRKPRQSSPCWHTALPSSAASAPRPAVAKGRPSPVCETARSGQSREAICGFVNIIQARTRPSVSTSSERETEPMPWSVNAMALWYLCCTNWTCELHLCNRPAASRQLPDVEQPCCSLRASSSDLLIAIWAVMYYLLL